MVFYGCVALAAALFGYGLLNETTTPSAASPNCSGQELAGRWLNLAKPDGSDVLQADLQIPCTGPAAAAGRGPKALLPLISLQMTVRCLHVLSCDWQAVPAKWTVPEQRGGAPVLQARYDQDRFERLIAIEPTDDGKLRLTMTSRFKGVAVAPVKSVYTLERQKT